MTRIIHRSSAIILGLFIISHLMVHLTAIFGAQAHETSLKLIQPIYRNPVGETVLIAAIIIQIVTGLRRLKTKRPPAKAGGFLKRLLKQPFSSAPPAHI